MVMVLGESVEATAYFGLWALVPSPEVTTLPAASNKVSVPKALGSGSKGGIVAVGGVVVVVAGGDVVVVAGGDVVDVAGGEVVDVAGGEVVDVAGGDVVDVAGGDVVDVAGGDVVDVAGGDVVDAGGVVVVVVVPGTGKTCTQAPVTGSMVIEASA